MIVSFSSFISGARGTFGGVTFSANGSGPYVFPYAVGPVKNTPPLQALRAKMSQHGQNWRSLSQALRDGWQTWSHLIAQKKINSLGQDYWINGWQWFVALNQRLELMGRSRITAVPITSIPTTPTLSSLTVTTPNNGTATIVYPSLEWLNADMVLQLSLRSGNGQAVSYLSRSVNIQRLQSPIHATTVTVTDLADFVGQVQAGQRAFLWAFRQNTEGRISAPFSLYDDVA